jgi:phosphate transport system substrate-binding protein
MQFLVRFAAAAAALLATPVIAAEPPAGTMIDIVQPTMPTNRPQTDAEKKLGMEQGRRLPPPELLQPSLDPALPAYVPARTRLRGHFKGAASDVLAVLVRHWADAFRKYQPGIVIDVPPPYAGSLGAKELVKQNLDFVFVSRELKPDDITDFQAKFGYPPLSVPISGGSYRAYGALDAVGFIVNRDNPLDQLSFAQLDALLSTTRHRGGSPIRTWGELGLTGEWADKPVHVYAIKPWNGFEEFIRQRVLSTPGRRGEWRTDLNFSDVVFPIARAVAKDRYALGYTGLAYLDAPVKVIALQPGSDGAAIPATYEAVARADYPLSRLTFFNVNRKPGTRLDPALEEFLRFILSREGQAIVRDQGTYMPLRGRQVGQSRELLTR